MNKAVFLDRDGVIIDNRNYYYIWKQDQVSFIDGISENLKMLVQEGFQLFIVSNQGGISRGCYSKNDIEKLHDELIQAFREQGIVIVEILYCPHHSEIEKCLCRKPGSLMIDKLIAKYGLQKESSYFIGDSDSDMEAARNAGIQEIKIVPNQNMYPFISVLLK